MVTYRLPQDLENAVCQELKVLGLVKIAKLRSELVVLLRAVIPWRSIEQVDQQKVQAGPDMGLFGRVAVVIPRVKGREPCVWMILDNLRQMSIW